MGITDFFTDVWETFSHPSADAEGQPPVQGGTSTNTPASGTDEESSEEADVNKQDAKSGGDSESRDTSPVMVVRMSRRRTRKRRRRRTPRSNSRRVSYPGFRNKTPAA